MISRADSKSPQLGTSHQIAIDSEAREALERFAQYASKWNAVHVPMPTQLQQFQECLRQLGLESDPFHLARSVSRLPLVEP